MILIMTFNRRRPGETDRTTVEDFLSYEEVDPKCEHFQQLNKNKKEKVLGYRHYSTEGKKINGIDGSYYYIKLDSECFETISNAEYREEAGISAGNPFLFALPNRKKNVYRHASAFRVLCEFVDDCCKVCELRKPNLIRGTNLRKALATKAQGEKAKGKLAGGQMGHTFQESCRSYRQKTAVQNVEILEMLEDANASVEVEREQEIEEEAFRLQTKEDMEQDKQYNEGTGIYYIFYELIFNSKVIS